MEELKELLSEKYLKIGVYYKETFKVFGKILKEEKKYILYLSLVATLASLNIFFVLPAGLKILDTIKTIAIFSVLNASYYLLYRKIIYKIEGEKNLEFKKVISKIVVLGIIITILEIYILDETFIGKNSFNAEIIIAGCFVYISEFLYFSPLYISRNINFIEALNYNFNLNKGNRIRMWISLFPLILFMQAVSAGTIFIFENLIIVTGEKITVFIFSIFISKLIEVTVMILISIMMSIVYLNVEYMDRKKIENSSDLEE